MPSVRSRLVRSLIVERVMRRVDDLGRQSIEEHRCRLEKLAGRQILPRGTRVERLSVEGLPAELVRARDVSASSRATILYFHGGGYVAGSCATHRDLAARISAASDIRVLVVDYRLAPENPYPAAFEDALLSFRWLVASGVEPGRIVLAGDSAGGGLALATLLGLRDSGEELPRAAVLLSPWLSQVPEDDSYYTRASVDPLLSKTHIRACAEAFLAGQDPVQLVLFDRDLRGLPSMLVQVGGDEILLDDSQRLAERGRAAGVEVRLEVWPGMWHVFQSFAVVVPEARRALASIGSFVAEKLEESPRHG
jgi:monoterpene epsilon-lactone hydrolase